MAGEDKNQEMMEALANLATSFSQDFAVLLEKISTPVRELTGFEKIMLALERDESEFDIFECEAGRSERKAVASQGTALRAAMTEGKPIVDLSLGKFSPYFDMRKLYSDGYGSCIILPLPGKERTGAVAFIGRKRSPTEPSQEQFLRVVAGTLASLVRASLSASKSDEARRMCDIVFDGSSEAVAIVEIMEGKAVSSNARATDLTGLSAGALSERSFYELYPNPGEIKERVSKAKAGGMQEFVSLFKRKGGERFVRTRLKIVKDDKNPLAVFSCLDVTESMLSGAYEGVITGFGDILFSIDSEKRFVSVSQNVQAILGYPADELAGEPFATVVATKDNTLINELIGWMRSKSDRVDGLEMRLISKSGSARLFTVGARGFFDSSGELMRIYGVLRDVDSVKQANEQEQVYSEILSDLSDGVWGMDQSGYIRYWNKSAERFLGYSKEEVMGKDARMLFPPEKDWELSWALSGKSPGKPFESERMKKNGEPGEFRVVQKTVKDSSGAPVGYVEILKDIELEKKLRENEKERRQLEKKNKDLREINEISTAFVSNVSHEIRTPLTSIHGFSLLLQEDESGRMKLSPEQKHHIDVIVSETDRLAHLINDVLDVSRLDSMRFKLEPREFDLASLKDKCSCVYLAEKKGLYVVWEFEEDLPPVYADQIRISQVFINLISNAIKFTDSGGVTVKAFRKSKGHVQVDVTDTGEGIPESEQDYLFKRFFRGSTGKKREGTGLGLAIAKQIIQLHRGKIWVESKQGKGSTFSFILPTKKREKKKQQAAASQPNDVYIQEVKAKIEAAL